MRNLSELQMYHSKQPIEKQQPQADQLAFVENLIGAHLPETYVTFLMFSNGGQPGLNTFYSEFEGNEQSWTIEQFYHLNCAAVVCTDPNDVVWQYQQRWPGAPSTLLPIAHGDKNLFLLDLAEIGAGSIVSLAQGADPDLALNTVADSFERFIDGLTRKRSDDAL